MISYLAPTAVAGETGALGQIFPTDSASRVIFDSRGAIHVLWIIPPNSSSRLTPGVWYAEYESNGTNSIPPKSIRNSSLVQFADMAVDRDGNPHIAWTEGTSYANTSLRGLQSDVESALYYAEFNSTQGTRIVPTELSRAGKIVMWPSVAIDRELTTHLVWTEVDVNAGHTRAVAYYGIVRMQKIVNQTVLIAAYNQSLVSIPRTSIALDPLSDDLHVAWVETDELPNGQLVSSVGYAKVDLGRRNVTRLEVAKFNQTLQDAAITAGPGGDAYVVWQQRNISRNSNLVYVAQVSRNVQIGFLKQLSPSFTQTPISRITVSVDLQDNLYVVWFQQGLASSESAPQATSPSTNISYLKLNRDGAITESKDQVFGGPVIAVAVSGSGDLYAVSQQGIVRVALRTTSPNFELIGVAVATVFALAGAFATEDFRYRMLRHLARSANLNRRSDADDTILRMLSHRPGLKLRDLRSLSRSTKPTMLKLALLERSGHISSIRTGLSRRFYTSSPAQSVNIQGTSLYEAIPSRILHKIERNPDIWEAKLAQDLGLSQQIVHYHLKKLMAARILLAESIGRRKHYRLPRSHRDKVSLQEP